MKRISAILLIFSLVFSANVFAFADFNAPKHSRDEWNMLYNLHYPNNNLPMLCVGANETEVSLCWHADKENAVSLVRLSENSEMNDFVEFKGIKTEAEKDSKLAVIASHGALMEAYISANALNNSEFFVNMI